jgi:predicted  nucleic acid-binding Zn ribbon protein
MSAMVEHSTNLGHCIQLENISILVKKFRYMDQVITAVREIKLYLNMNREDGFSLSNSQKLPICMQKTIQKSFIFKTAKKKSKCRRMFNRRHKNR